MNRPIQNWIAALALLAGACAHTVEGQGQPDADLPPTVSTVDAAPLSDAGPETLTLTLQASAQSDIVAGNSVSCNGGSPEFFHAENRYYRTYPLAVAGITKSFLVSSVSFGVQEAKSPSGTQPINVSLYTLEGIMSRANLSLLATTTFDVEDQELSTVEVPMAAEAPEGSTLVVEVHTPTGQDSSRRFFIGSNVGSEALPGYIQSDTTACGITEAVKLEDLGVENLKMSMVINVTGSHLSY